LADIEKSIISLDSNENVNELEEFIDKIKVKIDNLGAINLAAIDELQEQQERKQYLDNQYDDLSKSVDTLENVIKKIDNETKSKFKEIFDSINDNLNYFFTKIFGGGKAYLELTSNDLLNTGVSIMARPPGKLIKNISLLSGGEKAGTGIAFVFSIFKINPAPFCLLDEVDAPLDEANNNRYCNIVKEMSETVQFIFITHNKSTMELADVLSGVTMKEAGVSKLVSVNINEAVDLSMNQLKVQDSVNQPS
jgi:chromosome segregation protein